MGNIFNQRNQSLAQAVALDSITLGTVISNSDPHQMGRLKVLCPSLGDNLNDISGDTLPWASKVAPFGGTTNSTVMRGPNKGARSKGPIAYGFWNVPKVGSTVLIACIDGDPYYRLWLGSIFDQGAVHTMPHGRYFYNDTAGEPEGPLDSYEQPIEPLYTNQTAAFGAKSGNYEWRTRGADFSASGNSSQFTELAPSSHADETDKSTFTAKDGSTFDVQNGYAKGRSDSVDSMESSVFAWTSPGFHSISMDDRPENCRIRVRTTSGAQILMDDTNERIYISTPSGKNWIEMDYNGDIDHYGRRVSVHATEELNLTSDKTVRIYGEQGIDMYTPNELRMEAKKDAHLVSHQNVRTKSDQNTYIESGHETMIKAGGSFLAQAKQDTSIKAGMDAYMEAGGEINNLAVTDIKNTAEVVHNNGDPASPAYDAKGSATVPAKWTNRVPQHEPYARGLTKTDYTHDPEHTYDDASVGKVERGVTIDRGELWRR